MLKCLPRSTGAPEWPRPADMPALLHRLLCLRGMRSEEEAENVMEQIDRMISGL